MWILGDIYSVWVFVEVESVHLCLFKTNFGENLTIIYLNIFFNVVSLLSSRNSSYTHVGKYPSRPSSDSSYFF